MAFAHGKDAVFWIDNAAGTLVDITAFVDSVEFSNSVEVAESTTFGKEAKTYLGGLSDATLSISGKYDSTLTVGPDVVLFGLVGNEAFTAAFEYGPEGGTTGKIKYSGETFLTGYSVSAPVGDIVVFSADFQVTGAITRGAFA